MSARCEHFADAAVQVAAPILEHVQLARETFRVRVACPQLARRARPGQFVMVRLSNCSDPLLGRPLALYDVAPGGDGAPEAIDLVYLCVGKLTRKLATCRPGDVLHVWGPLGNGFTPAPCEHLLLVAGGIGQTPFPAVARAALHLRQYGAPPQVWPRVQRVTLCYGARTAAYLAGLDDFARLGVQVRTSTDDGSAGHHGRVTDLLQQELDANPTGVRVLACGPEPMLAAVGQIVAQRGVPCELSLETPMACGLGICFTCVAQIRQSDGSWDYRRTCVEGPIFPAEQVVFPGHA